MKYTEILRCLFDNDSLLKTEINLIEDNFMLIMIYWIDWYDTEYLKWTTKLMFYFQAKWNFATPLII